MIRHRGLPACAGHADRPQTKTLRVVEAGQDLRRCGEWWKRSCKAQEFQGSTESHPTDFGPPAPGCEMTVAFVFLPS